MKLRKKMVWTLIVLVGIAWFGAGSTALAESPKRGGKLVVAFGADHRGLEPHYAIGWETLWLSMNLYTPCVKVLPNWHSTVTSQRCGSNFLLPWGLGQERESKRKTPHRCDVVLLGLANHSRYECAAP